jgi:hypothetical protein
MQDLHDLGLPESDWSEQAKVAPEMVAGVTRDSLRRMLAVLRASPTQMYPAFG